MGVNDQSLAATNSVGVKNVQFQPIGNVLQRKMAIIGTYPDTLLGIIDDTPEQFFSAAAVGDKFGLGTMLHRLALKTFQGGKNLETWVVPQSEDGGAAKSTGLFAFLGTATEKGTISLFIAGEPYASVSVAIGDTAVNVVAGLQADVDAGGFPNAPVDSAIGADPFEDFEITAKDKGPWGDFIDLSAYLDGGQLPAGITLGVTVMTGGTNVRDISSALAGLGTGDNQNEKFFTAIINGYNRDGNTLDQISTYNGVGNDFVGNYSKTVRRPFRSLACSTIAQTANGQADAIATADADRFDRTNGLLVVPDSESHPAEIAALALSVMELISATRPEQSYIDEGLPGIRLGADSERYTRDYDVRDSLVKGGISPTLVKSNILTLQNVVTFYRPAAVAPESNGYRSQRNVAILQNVLSNFTFTFDQEKWKGITIVADVAKVTNITARIKARDANAVIDELVGLAIIFEGRAWIFSADFTIEKLSEPNQVILRVAGNGFDSKFKIILSGEGGILNTDVEFDVSLAAVL